MISVSRRKQNGTDRGISDDVTRHYVALARQIQAWCQAQGNARTIGVTSCRSGEGVTTVVRNLGASFAGLRSGRVLMVDANLDRPGLTQQLQGDSEIGLSEMLLGARLPDDRFCQVDVKDLYLLGAGNRPTSASGLLAEFDSVLSLLKRKFLLTIFDLPQAHELTPCFAMAPKLDGIVLVVESDAQSSQSALRAKTRLERLGATIVGVVVNKVER